MLKVNNLIGFGSTYGKKLTYSNGLLTILENKWTVIDYDLLTVIGQWQIEGSSNIISCSPHNDYFITGEILSTQGTGITFYKIAKSNFKIIDTFTLNPPSTEIYSGTTWDVKDVSSDFSTVLVWAQTGSSSTRYFLPYTSSGVKIAKLDPNTSSGLSDARFFTDEGKNYFTFKESSDDLRSFSWNGSAYAFNIFYWTYGNKANLVYSPKHNLIGVSSMFPVNDNGETHLYLLNKSNLTTAYKVSPNKYGYCAFISDHDTETYAGVVNGDENGSYGAYWWNWESNVLTAISGVRYIYPIRIGLSSSFSTDGNIFFSREADDDNVIRYRVRNAYTKNIMAQMDKTIFDNTFGIPLTIF